MAAKLLKNYSVKNVVSGSYVAQTAIASKQTYSLPQHQPQVTKLPSGGVVASLENNSPISRIAIFVKSGSRYETTDNCGVSHMVRLAAGKATKNFTEFGITRRCYQMGGVLVAQNGREHMAYGMSFKRNNLNEGFTMLSDVVARPAFKEWEMIMDLADHPAIPQENGRDLLNRMNTELGGRNSCVLTFEMLHNAAFRNSGLGNSLFIPEYKMKKITPAQMHDFIKHTHTGQRFAFVGLGVEHGDLVKLATRVKAESGSGLPNTGAYGGGELRKETGGSFAYVSLAGPGAKLGSENAAALAVAQFVLGGTSGTKYGSNASSLIAGAIRSAGGNGNARPINVSYTDGGLFGFYLEEEAQNAGVVLRAVSKAVRTLKVTEDDVKKARTKAKAAILLEIESNEGELEEMGMQTLFTGSYDPSKALSAIDNVTAASVQAAMASVTKGKPSMAAIGNLASVPYLDQF